MMFAAVVMLSAAVAPAIAQQPMTVAEFIVRTNALRAMGAEAAASPELQQLKDEMTGVVAAYRADLAAASRAGEPPHSCPPPRGQTGLTSTDLIREFNAIPPTERDISVKDAFYTIMQKRYPCAVGAETSSGVNKAPPDRRPPASPRGR